jgi:hypothetical protein
MNRFIRVNIPVRDMRLLSTVSRPIVGSIHCPVIWVPDAFALGAKRLEHKADNSQPSGADVNTRGRIISLPHQTRKPIKNVQKYVP